MSKRRQPEANIEVFELGHYETMHLHMLLHMETTDAKDEEVYDSLSDALDRDCIETLRHIFAHGTLTIIRKDDPQ